MNIRNTDQLIAYIRSQIESLKSAGGNAKEIIRLEYALVEINDALYHGDIHRLLELRDKYGK